jgi:hypothetical protein
VRGAIEIADQMDMSGTVVGLERTLSLLGALPPARELIADRGHDSTRFRAALAAKGTFWLG